MHLFGDALLIFVDYWTEERLRRSMFRTEFHKERLAELAATVRSWPHCFRRSASKHNHADVVWVIFNTD